MSWRFFLLEDEMSACGDKQSPYKMMMIYFLEPIRTFHLWLSVGAVLLDTIFCAQNNENVNINDLLVHVHAFSGMAFLMARGNGRGFLLLDML